VKKLNTGMTTILRRVRNYPHCV